MATLWPESNAMVATVANDAAESLEIQGEVAYFFRYFFAKKLQMSAVFRIKLLKNTIN